ncbi:MAG: DNA polymerase III subunit gamma/tau [Eubacteriales bacterium]
MYQALYRKWRPKTFGDVYGQEHITKILAAEIKSGRTSHAYLFTGTRGTGKTSCAKIFAKAVNCLSPVDGSPCNECAICKGIDRGTVMDVVEMDAASNNKVDDIRDLRGMVDYTPADASYKVYIIDEVHMLSTSAFNALLKTLEEPPEHIKFILATTEVQKIPVTILSRCQRFDFKRIPIKLIEKRLAQVAASEGLSLSPEASALISRMSGGAMRDALSLLERCAGQGNDIDRDSASAVLGDTGREIFFDLAGKIAAEDIGAALELSDRINSIKEPSAFADELLSVLRDMLVIKNTADPSRYVDAADSEMAELRDTASRFDTDTLILHCDILEDTLKNMSRLTADKRVLLELAIIRMCRPAQEKGSRALQVRLSALENRISELSSGVVVSSPKKEEDEPAPPLRTDKSDKPAAEREVKAEQKPDSPQPEKAFAGYGELIEGLTGKNSMIAGFLRRSKCVLCGDTLYIRTADSFTADMLNKPDTKSIIEQQVGTLSKKKLSLIIEHKKQEDKTTDDFFN